MQNKGVSIISLIVTIIIIVIIAAISAPLLSSVIDDAFERDAKEELANVENVVLYARGLIKIDEFTPNPEYVISNEDLNAKFGEVLSADELKYISDSNSGDTKNNIAKFYLMNQNRFEQEFGNGFNIDGIRGEREYLVNYSNGIVIANYNGTKVTNANEADISVPDALKRGGIDIALFPNGNSIWLHSQSTQPMFSWDDEVNQLLEVTYYWSPSVNQPSDALITNAIPAGIINGRKVEYSITIDGETGNGWYLWIKARYKELQTGREQTKYFHSNPFFLDNTPPSAVLEVNQVK